MNPHVSVERTAILECLLTLSTREFLLCRMNIQLVILQSTQSMKRRSALITNIPPRPYMGRYMSAEIRRTMVGIITVRTLAGRPGYLAVTPGQVFPEREVGAEQSAAVVADQLGFAGARRAAQVAVQVRGRLELRLTAEALQIRCQRQRR